MRDDDEGQLHNHLEVANGDVEVCDDEVIDEQKIVAAKMLHIIDDEVEVVLTAIVKRVDDEIDTNE